VRIARGVRTVSVPAGPTAVSVALATVRLRMEWATRNSGGGVGVVAASPVAVNGSRVALPWWARRGSAIAATVLAGQRNLDGLEEEVMEEPLGTLVGKAAHPEAMVKALTAAGTGQGAVGPVTKAGDRSVVPLVETLFAGGYGGGGGVAGEGEGDIGGGGGGGGFGRSRTVAVVEVTPDGVRVKPVVDTTAIVLAALSSAVGLVAVLRRARRR
jgi:uncharacterized spore protein YtfJ